MKDRITHFNIFAAVKSRSGDKNESNENRRPCKKCQIFKGRPSCYQKIPHSKVFSNSKTL